MSTDAARLEAPRLATAERRPAFAGAWIVSGSMLASGILIYAFHVLAARALGPAAYGQIAVLWAAMFLVVIVFFRPLEQTASRALADRLARGEEGRTVVRSVVAVGAVILLALAGATVLGWSTVSERLFLGDDAMTALLLAGIAGYGIAYLARGVVAGIRWFEGYGIGLLVDGLARIAIAVPLVVVASKVTAGAAVALAGVVGGLVPLWIGRDRLRAAFRSITGGERFQSRSAVRFALPASLIAASDQLLVNCGALLVMVEGRPGASATAGVVFAATMLVRVPVYVFQGVAASLLPNLTHVEATLGRRRFRRAVVQATGTLLGVGLVIVAFAAVAGPAVMELVYGSEFAVGRTELVLLGAGVGCYLAASTLSQALLALDRGGRASACWSVTAVLFVLLFATLPGDAVWRISVAFAIACVVDLVLLAAVTLGRSRT